MLLICDIDLLDVLIVVKEFEELDGLVMERQHNKLVIYQCPNVTIASNYECSQLSARLHILKIDKRSESIRTFA